MGGTSRISREAYVRFCERLGVKFPGPTRRRASSLKVGSAAAQPSLKRIGPVHLPRLVSVAVKPSGPFAMNDVSMAWDSGTSTENWTEYRATESAFVGDHILAATLVSIGLGPMRSEVTRSRPRST